MPSKMARYNGTDWITVADFDQMGLGSKWFTGSGDPVGPATDSFYLDTVSKNIWYRLDPAGAWENVGNISDWESAWGIVARAALSGAQPLAMNASTSYDLAAVTFTPVAGRRYMLTMFVRAFGPASSGPVAGYGQILRAGVALAGDNWHRSEEQWDSLLNAFIYTSTTMGTTSVEFRYRFNNGGTVTHAYLDAASYFIIEDMGPSRGDTT
jgi:hypothetical protein